MAVFVRLMGNPPQVRIHSRLLVDVEETPKLLARLNEINSEAVHLHFFVHKGAVYGVADVPAAPFVSDHVASIWHYFGQITDGIDGLLQAEFGGTTSFGKSMPSAVKH